MADTPAAAPKTQTPTPSGATTPAAPTNTAPPESRFNRDDLLKNIGNPLTTDKTLSSYRYPESLGNNPEYPHWVAFYPLVRENSVYGQKVKEGGKAVIFDQSDQNRVDPEKAKEAAVASGALAGAALGLGKALSNAGGKSTSPTDGTNVSLVKSVQTGLGKLTGIGLLTAGGGVAGGLFGAAASGAAGKQRAVFGDTEIILHVSERVSASYSANWSEADLGGLVGAVAAGKVSVSDNFSLDGLAKLGGELGDYGMRKIAKVAGLTGFDALQNVIESTSKRVENPYKEQLFRSMGFRKFMFDYKFSPRDKNEAVQIFGDTAIGGQKKGIIGEFLKHMHPTTSSQGLFLSYPSEFLIVYYHNGKENKYARKISNCALINMSVDYGAEGFTTFSDGVPTEATVRLEFVELETLTAERIEKGF